MSVDLSPAAVTARLREVARLYATLPPGTPRIDMSPQAVTARLREVAALVKLGDKLDELGPPRPSAFDLAR